MTWWVTTLFIIFLLFLTIGIPIIISNLFLAEGGYPTAWNAEDVLGYYGTVLTGMIALVALIATIRSSHIDMVKQFKFNSTQLKRPFFIIKLVRGYPYNVVNNNFETDLKGSWRKKYLVDEKLRLSNNNADIKISLQNIGDGLALSPEYCIEMLAGESTSMGAATLPQQETVIRFSFRDNLNDKYVKEMLKSDLKQKTQKTFKHIFYTYISVNYKNDFGALYTQKFRLSLA